MQYLEAKLVRRYKRFLADVRLADGTLLTVHCPNTGSMKNCVEEGATVWLSHSSNPKRKYQYTWEMIRTARGHTIGINTNQANRLVGDALETMRISELSGYRRMKREVAYGEEKSRIDILLSDHPGLKDECYIEVKSVTLLEEPVSRGVGYFPDAVSERGAKHLRELMSVVRGGARAVLFFCVQHTGIREVRPAAHIDATYAGLLSDAHDCGVEVVAYKVRRVSGGLKLARSVPVVF
ncbi:MAG: DNA/RNA nuclease SfsA [Pseudomonadota bacterium]